MNDEILNIPTLAEWVPEEKNLYFSYVDEDGIVYARYEELYGLRRGTKFSYFEIYKSHYKKMMEDIVKHINYYLTFFDVERELYVSVMSIKSIVDKRPNLSLSAFKKLILKRVVTDDFVTKIKQMARYLFVPNIDTVNTSKYASTPKITNDQARQLTAVSFAFRCLVPICVHFSNNNYHFVNAKDYIEIFDKIYMKVIERFEQDDVPFLMSVCRFIEYRVNRQYNANRGTWSQKEQLYGSSKELYLDEILHEVTIVKSLHKYDYTQSIVSFIDGLVRKYNLNFKRENYKTKPFEIDNECSGDDDSEDYQTRAEQLEMSAYRVDESNMIIKDVNRNYVIQDIMRKYSLSITKEEIKFYQDNLKVTEVSQTLLNCLFADTFHDSYAIENLPIDDHVLLALCLKKWMQLKNLDLLAQISTARIHGKYRDNLIKNSKFIEKITSSDTWNEVIVKKYRYVYELESNYNSILRIFSGILNSSFEFVDPDPEVNGYQYTSIDIDRLANEVLSFLAIA